MVPAPQSAFEHLPPNYDIMNDTSPYVFSISSLHPAQRLQKNNSHILCIFYPVAGRYRSARSRPCRRAAMAVQAPTRRKRGGRQWRTGIRPRVGWLESAAARAWVQAGGELLKSTRWWQG
eukprot:gene14948-biopygen23146